jgi:hypothetical protein
MKNSFFLAIIALFIGISASAQSTVDSIAAKYQLIPMPAPLTIEKSFPVLGTYQLTTNAPVATTNTMNSTVGTTSTTSTTNTTTNTTTTPVEGTATTSTATGSTSVEGAVPGITITLDSASKGIVWVDGLPEGRFKAYLKKSPTTYRINSQKTNLGKQIPEGTLIYDETTNTLNISLGREYNEADPAAVFATNTTTSSTTTDASVTTAKSKSKTKAKSKVTFYTATKIIADPTGVQNSTSGVQNQQ